MRSFQPPTPPPRRLRVADALIGSLGIAVVRIVLGSARLWARVTRTQWHG